MTRTEIDLPTVATTDIVTEKFSYRKVLHKIADTSPIFRSKIRTFMAFHPPTALHVGRVARTLSGAAHEFGLDPYLGLFAGLGHDHGKTDQLRELNRSYVEPGSILNLHHVEVARNIFSEIPESELFPVTKRDLMAVTLKHHEILAPEGFAEPRVKQRVFLGPNMRLPVSENIRKMQILLALCDVGDRASWGLEGEGMTQKEDVQSILTNIARKSGELTSKDLEWIKMPVAYISEKITRIKVKEVEKDIMGNVTLLAQIQVQSRDV